VYLSLRDATAVPTRPPDVLRSSTDFAVNNRGIVPLTLDGAGGAAVGYASLEPASGQTGPAGMATVVQLLGIRAIAEVAIPLVPVTLTGRFYDEIGTDLETSLSFTNPGDQPVDVAFYFTDSTGVSGSFGTVTVGAKTEISALLSQQPFSIISKTSGTITFTAATPIAAVAIRGLFDSLTGQRRFSWIPITDPYIIENRSLVMPAFADSGPAGAATPGWKTVTALVNTTENTMTGEVRLFGPGNTANAGPISATLNGVTASVFPYSIPPRAAVEFRTDGAAPQLIGGFMTIVPASGSNTPAAYTTLMNERVLTSIEAKPASSTFRLFVDTNGNFDVGQPSSITTAMALANPFSTPTKVHLELFNEDGSPAGLSSDVVVPANGQLAAKLNQFPGFATLPKSFQGVLRGTVVSGQGIGPLGMHWRINSTSELVATTNGPIREEAAATTPLVIPHIAVGQGFETNITILGNSADHGTTGILKMFDEFANPLLSFIRTR
jgi:hypothetical protein